MTKEKPYPPGHNWEGLTPSEVNKAYEEKPLSEKAIKMGTYKPTQITFGDSVCWTKDVKEAVEDSLFDLSTEFIGSDWYKIKKIFKKRFGRFK